MRFKIRNGANRSLRRLYMIRGKMMSDVKVNLLSSFTYMIIYHTKKN